MAEDRTIKVDRPVTEHGEEWGATDDALEQFGLIDRWKAEYAVTEAMRAVGLDPDERHSGLRYVIQRWVSGHPIGEYEDDSLDYLLPWAATVPTCPDDEDIGPA